MIVVTHYQRLLNYIVPDFLHVLVEGRIVRSGGKELALELEEKGYAWLEKEPPALTWPRRPLMEAVAVDTELRARTAPPRPPAPRRGSSELRRAAFARFEELGFPTPKNEDWRYTRHPADHRRRPGRRAGRASPQLARDRPPGGVSASRRASSRGTCRDAEPLPRAGSRGFEYERASPR